MRFPIAGGGVQHGVFDRETVLRSPAGCTGDRLEPRNALQAESREPPTRRSAVRGDDEVAETRSESESPARRNGVVHGSTTVAESFPATLR